MLEVEREESMIEEIGPAKNVRVGVGEPGHAHRVERLLIVRPQEGADVGAAGSELEDLPGVVGVTLNTATGSFDILLDPVVVSDDELAAALHHQGYDLTSWQEVRATHAVQQRTWPARTDPIVRCPRPARTRGPGDLRGCCHEGFAGRLHPDRQGVRSIDRRRDRRADPGSFPRRAD
jgi:hypothetical protein